MVATGREAGADDVRREIIETVRRFVAREVVAVAPELERADEFPTGIVDDMRELGLFGVTIPERYGGLDLVTYVDIIEELAYGMFESPPPARRAGAARPSAPCRWR